MIPPFDERGYLPPGIHVATMEEVRQRFGLESEIRRAQFESLEWLLPMCRRAGVARLILNGSFVTDELDPNDVDCILLAGNFYDEKSQVALELKDGLPFLSLKVADQEEFDFFVARIFGFDRLGAAKGLIEVPL